ncbi:unnamed protein product [Phytophthora lilii]|uniref:Unnamed protein product n=1 Tax=Phytophthora lilii TaxID=2077276 RepID=A0A9W7D966_9STRA|nr:unnamed protein product [Phytophthora lilii]
MSITLETMVLNGTAFNHSGQTSQSASDTSSWHGPPIWFALTEPMSLAEGVRHDFRLGRMRSLCWLICL